MILEKGNMWSIYDQTNLFLITANSTVLTNGELVMGAGIAKEVKERFPDLPKTFGLEVSRKCGSYGFYGVIYLAYGPSRIGIFQTKDYWRKPSTLKMIMRSTSRLLDMFDAYGIYWLNNKRIDLNFPGIGKGGLKREEVLPIISVLPDNVHIWEL